MVSVLLQVIRQLPGPALTSLCVALLLAGCGGAPATGAVAAAGAEPQLPMAKPGIATDAAQGSEHSGRLEAGTPSPYELVLFNDRVVHQDLDQLDPRHGKGYAPLRAFVYVKGRPRAKSPVNSIKPVCLTPSHCEYLPPREAGVAERFTIAVDDPSIVQLSADKDVIVISSRQLQLAKPATVSVTLTTPGQAPVTKRIVYAAAAG